MKNVDYDALSMWAESDAAVVALEETLAAGSTTRGASSGEVAARVFASAGRPRLSGDNGKGASPRRQVRLPDELNARLDAYAKAQGLSPSAVMREALQKYLPASAA